MHKKNNSHSHHPEKKKIFFAVSRKKKLKLHRDLHHELFNGFSFSERLDIYLCLLVFKHLSFASCARL